MDKTISASITRLGTATSSPFAFLIVLIYGALWVAFEHDTLDWHGFATLATWLMTLVIQRSEHRDTQAIHAKLDDLLRANDKAQSHLSKIDEQEPEEIEQHRNDRKDDF